MTSSAPPPPIDQIRLSCECGFFGGAAFDFFHFPLYILCSPCSSWKMASCVWCGGRVQSERTDYGGATACLLAVAPNDILQGCKNSTSWLLPVAFFSKEDVGASSLCLNHIQTSFFQMFLHFLLSFHKEKCGRVFKERVGFFKPCEMFGFSGRKSPGWGWNPNAGQIKSSWQHHDEDMGCLSKEPHKRWSPGEKERRRRWRGEASLDGFVGGEERWVMGEDIGGWDGKHSPSPTLDKKSKTNRKTCLT